jgi:hypothetical protein
MLQKIELYGFTYTSLETGQKINIKVGKYENWLLESFKLSRLATTDLKEVIISFCEAFEKTIEEGGSIVRLTIEGIYTKTNLVKIEDDIIKCEWTKF